MNMKPLFAAAVAAFLLAPAAHAQLFRAYLSSTGSDANPCSLVAPCRLLPAALAAVASGGEIWMLDSANFNTASVPVTKSVSILAVPGALGSVVGTGGTPALIVNTDSTKVSLRNLRIVPVAASPGNHGISASGQVEVVIEGGVISGFTTHGVFASGPVLLRMSDTIVRDNGQSGVRVADGAQAHLTRVVLGRNSYGATVFSNVVTSEPSRLAITDSTIEYNTTGVWAVTWPGGSGSNAVVRSSTIDHNANSGVLAESSPGIPVQVSVQGSSMTSNGIGLYAFGSGARLVTGANLVAGNGTGLLQASSAILVSMGNNTLQNNATPKNGTITPLPTE